MKTEAKDPKEYGFEGEMVMSQLKGIMQHAESLHGMLKPDTDLPEWVQSKITLAYDYIQTATDYMSTEMNEEAVLDENTPADLIRSRSNFQSGRTNGGPAVRTSTQSITSTPIVNGVAQQKQTYGLSTSRHSDGTHSVTRSGAGWNSPGTRTYNPAAGTMTMGGKTYQKMPSGFYNKTPIGEESEAPTNAAGSGSIDGIGVGAKGEPGVRRTKYQKKNAAEAPKGPVMDGMVRRKLPSFKQFMG